MIQYVYDNVFVADEDDRVALEGWNGTVVCLGASAGAGCEMLLPADPDQPLSEATLRQATAIIHAQRTAGDNVTVYTPAGKMFAAVLPVAYLIEYHQRALPDAFVLISNFQALWPPPYPWIEGLVAAYDLPYRPDYIRDEYLPMQMVMECTQRMHHICDGIYLSSIHALGEERQTRRAGIRAVLRMDNVDRSRGQWSRAMTLLDLPIQDGETVDGAIFEQAVTFLAQQVAAKRKVLVHCQEGVSRSVTMVLAYLISRQGMTLGQAFKLVMGRRPVAHPHPALLWSLVQHYQQDYTRAEIHHPLFLRAVAQITPLAEE
jgi:hypothetical protein